MNTSLRWQFIFISLLQLNVHLNSQPIHSQTSNEDEVKARLPQDFMSFLESLDSKKNATTRKIDEYLYYTTTSPNFKNARRNMVSTQINALRDVLMMKLVSYYEDKYRISQHDDRMTTSYNNQDKYRISQHGDRITTRLNNEDKYRVFPYDEKLTTRTNRGHKYKVSRYDRTPQRLYREDNYRKTHQDLDNLSSKSYERDTLAPRNEYEDNKYRLHHYDSIIPAASAELMTTNNFAMLPHRRTFDITDAYKDISLAKNTVAEVIIL